MKTVIARMRTALAGGREAPSAHVSSAPDEVSAGDAQFLEFVNARFDPEGYLRRCPDVRAAGADPLQHWLTWGLIEGRCFAPRTHVVTGAEAEAKDGPSWRRFTWRGLSVAVLSTRSSDLSDPDDIAFVQFVETHFDREAYLAHYPDVRGVDEDPVDHWFRDGLSQGRSIAPGVIALVGKHAENVVGRHWQRFKWLGQPVAVRLSRLSDTLVRQIRDQGGHDGAVLAAGPLAIAALPELDAMDLVIRGRADVHQVFRELGQRPEIVLVTPCLSSGGPEKYAADIVSECVRQNIGNVLVIVTDQTSDAAEGWDQINILKPFKDVQIVFWKDVCWSESGHMLLARLIGALRPEVLIVNNNRVALDAVATFGRAISQNTAIYCTYFSYGLDGLGAQYGARFPSRTLPFSAALTDNRPMADKLNRMWDGLLRHGVAVLPPRLEVASKQLFDERIRNGLSRRSRAGGVRKWVWVSRIERFKGTEILAKIAALRPADEFHLFGSAMASLETLGLNRQNVLHRGVLQDVLSSDFSDYDGFVFTSLFEGMPNVVLEMSQHGIPLILTDVGGLADTFDSSAALLIAHGETSDETASRFDAALTRVAGLSDEDLVAMVRAAYHQARDRHGPDVYAQNVTDLFGGGK